MKRRAAQRLFVGRADQGQRATYPGRPRRPRDVEPEGFPGLAHVARGHPNWGRSSSGANDQEAYASRAAAIKIALRRAMHDPPRKPASGSSGCCKGASERFRTPALHPSLWWLFDKVRRLRLVSGGSAKRHAPKRDLSANHPTRSFTIARVSSSGRPDLQLTRDFSTDVFLVWMSGLMLSTARPGLMFSIAVSLLREDRDCGHYCGRLRSL
jgi:hypothetical protein